MTKKLLDIEKLKNDLEKNEEEIEGFMCYRYKSIKDQGNFCLSLDNKILDSYWIEVEI